MESPHTEKNKRESNGSEDILKEVALVLEDALHLGGRSERFTADTPLLGQLPEMDSLNAAAVIAKLEARFRITIDDDEIDGAVFRTLGTLVKFVEGKKPRL